MPRLRKGEREILNNRNLFTGWGEDEDIVETATETRFEYALRGKPFAVMEWRGDRVYFELRIAKAERDRVKAFESPRMAFVPLKRRGWYAIEIGANVKEHLEAGIGGLVGAIQRELRNA